MVISLSCLRKKTNLFRTLYPVVLGLSALCLLLSVLSLQLLPRKTFLNMVTLHYTLMLLIAYSTLILIQKPGIWVNSFNRTGSR